MLASRKQMDRSRLGRLLINRGYITREQLDEALIIQRETGIKLGQVMIDREMISERDLGRTLKHQERYRCAAAFLAVVVTPLQPVMAFASGPAGAIIPENRTTVSQLEKFARASGLRPLAEEEMGAVSAQGLVEDVQWLTGMINQARQGESSSTGASAENSNGIGQLEMLTHLILPMTNFLDSDTRVEGVSYDTPGQMMTFNSDGSLGLKFPSHIDRVSMENIRPRGSAGPSFGNLYFTDISMNMNVTVRPRF
ncbi:MAG: type II secretion protein ATPase [Gammaproteobacteria bacterium]|nr:MAG: type II secretion protein ATPase [Pseudomonadota bacterium]PIE38003.1 MAG: type II secretion protein ATPase [Gammaproteobacteria bacterium]